MEKDLRKIYTKIRQDAVVLAEEKLRASIADKTLVPDWHPYYGSFTITEKGIRFTLHIREGEREYFKKKKKTIPFDTAALEALEETVKKYSRHLLIAELVTDFDQTDGVETS